MQKWISVSCAAAVGSERRQRESRPRDFSVTAAASVSSIVESIRPSGLSEKESWALIRQTVDAIQDWIMNIDGGDQEQAQRELFTADDLMCDTSGKIHFANLFPPSSSSSSSSSMLRRTRLFKSGQEALTRELESTAVASLGKIVLRSLRRNQVSESLLHLLDQMTTAAAGESGHPTPPLLTVLQTLSEEWPKRSLAEQWSAPRVIAQLCKDTLNRRSHRDNCHIGMKSASCVDVKQTNGKAKRTLSPSLHRQVSRAAEQREDSHYKIEFSRLDTDESSPSPQQSPSSADSDGGEAKETKVGKSRYRRSLSGGIAAAAGSLHGCEKAVVGRRNLEAEDAADYENVLFLQRGRNGELLRSVQNLSKGQTRSSAQLNGTIGGALMSGFSSSAIRSRRKGSSSDGGGVWGVWGEGPQLTALPPPPPAGATTVGQRPGEVSSPSIITATSSTSNPFPPPPRDPPASSAVVRRKPSGRLLYRVVRPLAVVTPTPSPATKRCVGPEFVVMSAVARPIVLDLSRPASSSAVAAAALARVTLLDGRAILARVSPQSATAGELLDRVLSETDIKEAGNFCLAIRGDREGDVCEYWPLANDCKLSKVSPPGWGGARGARERRGRDAQSESDPLQLFLRFRFLPNSVDADLRDPNNKHQVYLQLRRDLLSGVCRTSLDNLQRLAGLAMHTEFGDFAEDVHGDRYFLPEHYLPPAAVAAMGGEAAARSSCVKLHRARRGQSQTAAELAFCREARSAMQDYGCHLFAVRESKRRNEADKGRRGRRHVGIHGGGISLFATAANALEHHRLLASHAWRDIARIQYDKNRFQLTVRQCGASGEDSSAATKLKFYVTEVKAKVMFDLSSAHHQRYLQGKWDGHPAASMLESPLLSGSDDANRRKKRKLQPTEGDNVTDTPMASDYHSVRYCNPREKSASIKSLTNKLRAKDKFSHEKLYVR
jgi:hypothetical protein